MTKTKLKLSDNRYTYLYKWEVKRPKAILQIVHGSKEHIKRYIDLIKYLNKNNITVLGIDLIGHGKSSIEQNTFGNMTSKAFNHLINDVETISQLIKKEYKNIPYTIYGHSMGSFVVRAHAIKYGAPKYIFSGTNEDSLLKLYPGLIIAKLTKLFRGKNKVNKLLEKQSYKAFDKKFKYENTELAWLSNNPQVKEDFNNDSLSGQPFTNESFIGMIKLLLFIRKKSSYKKIKTNDILIIAGEKDPVGQMSKGPRIVYKKLQKQNINTKIIIYKDGRHEVHNDKNKNKVYSDIKLFITKGEK